MNHSHADRALENLIGDGIFNVPGLGAIVYKNGAEFYSVFVGNRVVDAKNPLPVTRKTRFRAASVSKMFTVFTIMQLVERGKIGLDDDVNKYLKTELRNPNQPDQIITVKMLANHTSSIRDGENRFAPINEPVGEFFTYCNANYAFLGEIIENVTGERFDIYQRNHILSELETDADYMVKNLSKDAFDNLGAIYRKSDPRGAWTAIIDDYHGIRPPADPRLKNYVIGTDAAIFAPQGGLRISFEELTHALEMIMNGGVYRGRRILSRRSIETMLKPTWIYNGRNGDTYDGVMLNYGLGTYFIDGNTSARVCNDIKINLIGHTGVANGLLSGLFFEPKTRNGFIYMTNGLALDEDNDARARGIFSANYIWEEKIMSPLCHVIRDN